MAQGSPDTLPKAVLFWSFILLLVAFLGKAWYAALLWRTLGRWLPRQIMIAFLLNQVLSATYLLDRCLDVGNAAMVVSGGLGAMKIKLVG